MGKKLFLGIFIFLLSCGGSGYSVSSNSQEQNNLQENTQTETLVLKNVPESLSMFE